MRMCVCVCACVSEKEGEVYKGDSSSPRQGCQLTKAAQHASVCLGERGAFEVAKPCRCVSKVSTSLTPLLQALNHGILNMHTFKGDWPTPPGG